MQKTITFLCCILIASSYLNAQTAEIPFELKKDLILLKVKINEQSETNTFVFDTGATSDLIDSTTAKKLALKANYQQDVAGAGGTKTYDIILSQKLTLDSDVEITNTHLIITNLSALKEKLERNFDGIVGYSLVKDHITKIDYDNQKIVLYDKIEDVDTTGYKAIPFEFGSGIPIPQFDITITLKNGASFTGKIFFDSGANLSLLINTPFNEKNELSKKAGKSLISTSQNLHGESTSETIAIQSMNFAGFEMDEMTISVAHDKGGVSSYENYLGLLGSKVISRFNIILDYSTSTLYLKPNSKFKNPFEFPLSGMDLKRNDKDIVVDKVEESSSAYKKGIRKGDKIVSINSNSSGDIEIYRELLKEENKKVSLTIIDSAGKEKTVTLLLERLL